MLTSRIHLLKIQYWRRTVPSRDANFLSRFLKNVKDEFQKSREMKDNLKKFREEASRLEQSDALKKAREKYQSIEMETMRNTIVIKERFENIREKIQETIEEAQKVEIVKKAGQITEEFSKSAKDAAESLSDKSSKLAQTKPVQSLVQGVKAVKQEIDESTNYKTSVYHPPEKLRFRKEPVGNESFWIKANVNATQVELHKDSRLWESWKHFKDHNPYINKVLDWKTQYNESDHVIIRASRHLTDRISDLFGGIFQKTEMSEALTEICKLDPDFDKVFFLQQCQFDIIPNVLEALMQGELNILRDWCHEPAYNVLSTPILEAKKRGLVFSSKVLDISNVDLLMGKMIEQGPVLVVNFHAQEIHCLRDHLGRIVDGSLNKVIKVNYVWVMCRDPVEIDPKAAWRVMEVGSNSMDQML